MTTRATDVATHGGAAVLTSLALLPDLHMLGQLGELGGRGLYAALGGAAWALPLWLADETFGAWTGRERSVRRRSQWAGYALLSAVAFGLGSCGGRVGDMLARVLERSLGFGAYLLVLGAVAIIAARMLGRGRVDRTAAQVAAAWHRSGVRLPRRAVAKYVTVDVEPERALPPPLPRARIVDELHEVSVPVVAARPTVATPPSTRFVLPSSALLAPPAPRTAAQENADRGAVAQQITQMLWIHGVTCRVAHAKRGPLVDLFELTPSATQKLAPIRKLQEELATQHAGLRLCPMPGSGHLGIEIPLPAEAQRLITLREVMQTDARRRSTAALPLALGLTSTGEPVIVDLATCPHLLVAGATGAGKSVGLNTMLCSLLLSRSPRELRLGLIDPKVVELARYRELPHLIAPPATELDDSIALLQWACAEMDRRYQLFAELGVTDLDSANALAGEHMPRVVIILDEYADLSAVAGNAVEAPVTRIAQKARAAGIHVILATQRPSVDVVTGIIKANFPTRIAYKVVQREDSKTILGVGGAQQLLGRGDSLCIIPALSVEPIRVHSAYVSSDDIRTVCEAWRAQGAPEYAVAPCSESDAREDETKTPAHSNAPALAVDDYDRAIAYAQQRGHVSIRQLEAELGCGFKRAREFFERMKSDGLLEQGGPNNAMRFVGGE